MASVKLKIGDKCTITGKLMPHRFNIGDEVDIIRQLTPSIWDVCNKKTGDCDWVADINLELVTINKNNMKPMKDAVLKVARDLAKANNTVTTLEIKLELIRDYPYYFWDQATVSTYMSQFAQDGIFTYTDNGTYRVYSLATPTQVAATTGPVTKQLKTPTPVTSVPRRRGRPRKSGIDSMNRTSAVDIIMAGDFDSIFIEGIGKVTPTDIKNQKKSPKGYLTNAKLSKLTGIVVAGKDYFVK